MIAEIAEPEGSSRSDSVWRDWVFASLLAGLLGVVSGLACVGVRVGFRLLQRAFMSDVGLLPQAAAELSPWHRAMVPVCGAALATAVLVAARRWSRGEPFAEYVEAVRFENGQIPFGSTAWRTASSAFSVSSGAAVGREGSMIQFAAAVSSWFGQRVGFGRVTLARQVSYGAAAAVAAAYQAPIAGVLFALEIVMGQWNWTEIVPLLFASLAGWEISHSLLGGGPLFPVLGRLTSTGLGWTVPLALVLGLLGPAYQNSLRSLSFLRRLPAPLLWGGAIAGLLSMLQPAVWGNGDVALMQTLSGRQMLSSVLALLVLRLLATTACVGAGTVGGVFTPTLFAGAALGLITGDLLHVAQPVLMAVVGMSAFLAGVTHAPWMTAFMVVELTGQWHLLPLLLLLNLPVTRVAAFLSSRSLYAIATPDPAPAH